MNATKVLATAILLAIVQALVVPAQTNRPSFRLPRPGSQLTTPAWDQTRRINLRLSTFDLATNFVVAQVETGPEKPDQIACVVKPLSAPPAEDSGVSGGMRSMTSSSPEVRREAAMAHSARVRARLAGERADLEKATWIPFTATLPIDLGPGDGRRMVWIAGKWAGGVTYANGIQVRVDRTLPLIVITNPTTQVTSRPMIQLQGYSDKPLEKIRYDLLNTSKRVANEEGFVNHQDFDPALFEFRTNYFTCYDIELAPGTNTIVLRCEDLAGNIATNILTYLFTLEGDKTPPAISLDWPIDGHQLSGETFTVRGRLDDETARITALVSAAGWTNNLEGLVERNGYFWVEHIPLGPGSNHVSITATDAAGNSSYTNLVVRKSDEVLTIDPVAANQLSQMTVTVTGKVSPAGQDVWVNGVRAEVKANGTWAALKVPVLSPNGGTAVFDVTAIPRAETSAGAESKKNTTQPNQLVSVAAGLGTNAVILNASQPACGQFTLHLRGTAGRPFILATSTNLADWTPILTNLTSEETYNFTDTNVAGYRCRFFRVIPVSDISAH